MLNVSEVKQCSKCLQFKPLNCFWWRRDTNKYRNYCIECRSLLEKDTRNLHRIKNKIENESLGRKRCYKCGKTKELFLFAKNITKPDGRGSACLECDKIEKSLNRLKNKSFLNKRARERRKENPISYREKDSLRYYNNKLSRLFSSIIRTALASPNSSKNGYSAFDLVPYSVEELKNHLEKQFENWMTWDNHGRYIEKDWDDFDQQTWKWNIDHIIPQSFFKFSSAEDDQFQQCWALANLRPYSAKQNVLDGDRGLRKKKIKS